MTYLLSESVSMGIRSGSAGVSQQTAEACQCHLLPLQANFEALKESSTQAATATSSQGGVDSALVKNRAVPTSFRSS
jgi:hypothetical protein